MTILKIVFTLIMFTEFFGTLYRIDRQDASSFAKFGAMMIAFTKVFIFTLIITSRTFF